jgi:hypothetical protein
VADHHLSETLLFEARANAYQEPRAEIDGSPAFGRFTGENSGSLAEVEFLERLCDLWVHEDSEKRPRRNSLILADWENLASLAGLVESFHRVIATLHYEILVTEPGFHF